MPSLYASPEMSNGTVRILATLGTLLLYPIGIAIYNLYFHPLSSYPGPKSWAITRLAFLWSLCNGNLVHDVQRIHEKYGDVVRLAPNELSFAKAEAWNDVFLPRKGHLPFPKHPVWYRPPTGQPPSLITALNPVDHARMRGILNHVFTDKALRVHEPLITSYIDLLINRLRQKATAPETEGKGAVVDIVSWYNYTSFDIIGDLTLGESFNCLKESALHPWVATIFNHFRASAYLAAIRFYPILADLFKRCIPKSVDQMQLDHYQHAVIRIDRRVNLETQRDDFMTNVLKYNDEKGMSLEEIRATFSLLIIAGSETTATVLSGITNYLVQNHSILQKLVFEVRNSFANEKEISVAALRGLPYLNAVIEEGLRLCPPVPAGLPRVVPAGGETVCGHWLPENTNVSVPSWTINTSPGHFTHPKSFIPERWPKPTPPEFASDRFSASQPFAVGPRSCIGKTLAYTEMRLILARLMWNFDISLPVEGRSAMAWSSQKTYVLVEKKPFEIRIKDVRRAGSTAMGKR